METQEYLGPPVKELWWSLLEIPTQVLPCEICKIFKNTFIYRTPPVAHVCLLYIRFWNLRHKKMSFLELLLLKDNVSDAFFFKIIQKKEKILFGLKRSWIQSLGSHIIRAFQNSCSFFLWAWKYMTISLTYSSSIPTFRNIHDNWVLMLNFGFQYTLSQEVGYT